MSEYCTCATSFDGSCEIHDQITALKARLAEAEATNRHRDRQIAAIVTWLERNQPDVFRRGLWDAISECTRDSAASQPNAELAAEEAAHSRTIDQRDRAEEMADELAGALAALLGVEIGEHSSGNCPWQAALDAFNERTAPQPPAAPVMAEVERATLKFPTWPTDPLHAVAVLGEEFGELTKAVLQLTYEPHKTTADEVRTEAIQTAAMALRFVASLDRYEYRRGDQHAQDAASQPSPALDDGATQLDGLTCKASGDRILIAISATTLKAATDNHPEFWDGETDKNTVAVIDPQEWLKSVVRHITDEREDGSSLLTDMFDAAIKAAVENGEEGCEEVAADNGSST